MKSLGFDFSFLEDMKFSDINEEMTYYDTVQKALKILSNSLYGIVSNRYFLMYNKDIAETITVQARNVLLNIVNFINVYFKKYWVKDFEAHKILGIEVDENYVFKNDIVFFGVTDSIFLSLEEVLESIKTNIPDKVEFFVRFYNDFLSKKLSSFLENYARHFGVENCLSLEFQIYSPKGVWFAKNRYVMLVKWKGKTLDEEEIKIVGLEVKNKKNPKLSRDLILDFINFILREDVDENKVVDKIIEYKELFKTSKIEDISFSTSLNKYNEYVLNDKDRLILEKKTPLHIKGSAIYNFLINRKGLVNKYNLLKNGDRIKYFYTTDKMYNVLSFYPGSYPYELDMKPDIDLMFEKSVLDVIKRLVKVFFDLDINSYLYKQSKILFV